jgi:hypothetical protein
VPNKATREVRQFCQKIVADADYRANLERRLREGTLPPVIEQMLWFFAVGKPPASLDVSTNHTVTLASIIAGTARDDYTDD